MKKRGMAGFCKEFLQSVKKGGGLFSVPLIKAVPGHPELGLQTRPPVKADEGIANMSWSEFVDAIEAPELITYLKERRLYINENITAEEDL